MERNVTQWYVCMYGWMDESMDGWMGVCMYPQCRSTNQVCRLCESTDVKLNLGWGRHWKKIATKLVPWCRGNVQQQKWEDCTWFSAFYEHICLALVRFRSVHQSDCWSAFQTPRLLETFQNTFTISTFATCAPSASKEVRAAWELVLWVWVPCLHSNKTLLDWKVSFSSTNRHKPAF